MIAAVIKSLKQAKQIEHLVSVFIVPMEDFSINYENTFSLEEVKKIKKPIFVVINKNIHNKELDKLEKLLKEIEKLNTLGIIFYDIALVNLKKKLNLKTPLVWAQEHLTTNYQTVNYWFDKGCEYAYLSSEITKKEMDEILKNSKAKLFINVFGYLPMFTSRRNLVNNYVDYFKLENNGNNKMSKESKDYRIIDKEKGTTIYTNFILNALDQDFKGYEYLVFNSNFISDNDFYDTLLKYKESKKDYKFPFNYGFLYQETIYKVKKNV